MGYLRILVFFTLLQFSGNIWGQAGNAVRAVVSPVKMNVLYMGIDNPLDVAVPGVAAKDVSANYLGEGSITKTGDGHFVVVPRQVGSVKIQVLAKGKLVSLVDFRVKRIPDPIVLLGGTFGGGDIRKELFLAQSGIIATYRNVDFDLHIAITSFNFTRVRDGQLLTIQTKGPMFSSEMKALMAELKTGDKVIIEEVVVVLPDSQPRKLNAITFTIL